MISNALTRATRSFCSSSMSSLHQRGRSPDGRARPGRVSRPLWRVGRGGVFRRLEDSLLGDVLGAICLAILLVAGLLI